VHAITSSYTVTVFARAALDDVAMGVLRFVVVGDMLRGRSRPVPSSRFRMNRGLSLSYREGSASRSEAGSRRLEAELSACCIAAVSRSSQISS
jgi:hypothetical protein